jgi:hypothetical protein
MRRLGKSRTGPPASSAPLDYGNYLGSGPRACGRGRYCVLPEPGGPSEPSGQLRGAGNRALGTGDLFEAQHWFAQGLAEFDTVAARAGLAKTLESPIVLERLWEPVKGKEGTRRGATSVAFIDEGQIVRRQGWFRSGCGYRHLAGGLQK